MIPDLESLIPPADHIHMFGDILGKGLILLTRPRKEK